MTSGQFRQSGRKSEPRRVKLRNPIPYDVPLRARSINDETEESVAHYTETASPRRSAKLDQGTRPRSSETTSRSHRETPKRRRRDRRDEAADGTDAARQRTRIETHGLTTLKPFALHRELFSESSDVDIQALAGNIRQNGTRHLIGVLPENRAGFPARTILDGHHRK